MRGDACCFFVACFRYLHACHRWTLQRVRGPPHTLTNTFLPVPISGYGRRMKPLMLFAVGLLSRSLLVCFSHTVNGNGISSPTRSQNRGNTSTRGLSTPQSSVLDYCLCNQRATVSGGCGSNLRRSTGSVLSACPLTDHAGTLFTNEVWNPARKSQGRLTCLSRGPIALAIFPTGKHPVESSAKHSSIALRSDAVIKIHSSCCGQQKVHPTPDNVEFGTRRWRPRSLLLVGLCCDWPRLRPPDLQQSYLRREEPEPISIIPIATSSTTVDTIIAWHSQSPHQIQRHTLFPSLTPFLFLHQLD